MADLSGLLTQKLGPFPGWVWMLGVGGLVFLVGPKILKGGSATAASQPGTFDPQSFEAGFAQGAAYQPGPATQTVLPPQTKGLSGADVPYSMDQVNGQLGPPAGIFAQGKLHMPPVGTAVGGPARNRSASVGSLSADPHAYFHPSIKRVPQFGHFVRAGVGGATGGAPVAHAAAVHQLAHQAEIHPARLHMLNPRPHRFVRVA